jgi:hypothetical protein
VRHLQDHGQLLAGVASGRHLDHDRFAILREFTLGATLQCRLPICRPSKHRLPNCQHKNVDITNQVMHPDRRVSPSAVHT